MAVKAGLVLFFVFVVLLVLGVPTAMSIAFSSMMTLLLVIPFDVSAFSSAQKMVGSINSSSLIAIPFFVFSGTIMNNEGIAKKLVDFTMLFVGRVPGALVHTNMLGNALLGSISSSAIVTSTTIDGVLIPQQVEEGYDRKFATTVNTAPAPADTVIPPSTAFIMYSSVADGTSISALFMGGYLVGIFWSLGIMLVTFIVAEKNKYPVVEKGQMAHAGKIIKEAIPSLLSIFIIIGGILTGMFTAVEASVIAVIYSLLIAMFCYKTVKLKGIPNMLLQSIAMPGTIMFLLVTSFIMSFVMTFTGIPQAISSLIMGVTDNKLVILLLANLVLLLVGIFMDIVPVILIFTPVLLPIVTSAGVNPVHYGLFSIMNLCVGSITLPVGIGLYIGASVGGVKAEAVLKPLLLFYGTILVILFLITYFPQIVIWLPSMLSQENNYVEHYNQRT